MRPRRIAYLLTAFPTVSETFVEGEIRALLARGFALDLYATRNFRETAGEEDPGRDRGLSVCRLPYLWSRDVWASAAFFLFLHPLRTLATLLRVLGGNAASARSFLQTLALLPKSLAFARRMRKGGTLHVHGTWGHYPATCAYVASRLLELPFSFSAHAGLDVTASTAFQSAKVRAARFVLTCNEANRRVLAERNPGCAGKIHTVYHGVDLSAIPSAGSQNREDPPLILSVGRLAPEKGFLDLLEACRLLRDRGIRFRLRVYGEGPQRPRLQEAIRGSGLEGTASLEGVAPHGRILENAARATLVVLASYEGPGRYLDGIANVLVEAMACGTPVVSTAYPGSRELLEDGRLGLLVPPRDPRSLAEAMEGLLASSARRSALAAAGRLKVVTEFDRDKNVERIAALFRESLEARERRGKEDVSAGRKP